MSRDPKRIKKILKKIEQIWEKAPDLRLMQLLFNVVGEDIGYYIEDDELITELERAYAYTKLVKGKDATGKR